MYCEPDNVALLTSQLAQTNRVHGIGYVSQEGSDYQLEQCYPTSPCEREELSRDDEPVSVTVSVNDSKKRPMQ